MKQVIHHCILNILDRTKQKYAKLNDIYKEVAAYLEVENNSTLQSQIRGRLQEGCDQYSSFTGEHLFVTEKVRSGNWTVYSNQKKYIRYKNNTYLTSYDDWFNVEKVNSLTEEYILEENLDNVYKAKLIDQIGKEKAFIIIAELDYIRVLLKKIKEIEPLQDGYGLAFEVFAISVIYNIDYEECINQYIIHGSNDAKIDAIYYGELNNIYVYQIKIGDITDNVYQEMQKNYDSCIRNQVPKDGKDLYDFIKRNKSMLKNKNVVFRSISNNSKRNTNYNPLEIYHMFFENRLLPVNNNNLVLSILKPTIMTEIGYQYNVSTDKNNNFSFYINAIDLIKSLLEALGINYTNYDHEHTDISRYFTDNVRGVLSVNKKMIHTIETEPENFVKYNNGINITGEVEDLGNQIIIKNPVINNGQQTITTLMREGKNLNLITIPVKITNESNIIIKGKISQFSNEQVKVKSIDMLSLNSYVRNIQSEIFHSNEPYFLEIYSSGKKSYYTILTKLYKKNNIIPLLDFVKLYFSYKNKKDLGGWKNNPNTQIEKTEINDFFDKTVSIKVCKAIVQYENYIETVENKKEKDDFKSADLAFKYLLCKENLEVSEAVAIINKINQKYFYDLKEEKSKLIDIYKSSTIINKIEEELKIYKNQNMSVNN